MLDNIIYYLAVIGAGVIICGLFTLLISFFNNREESLAARIIFYILFWPLVIIAFLNGIGSIIAGGIVYFICNYYSKASRG